MRKDKSTKYGDGELQLGFSTWDGVERSARVYFRNKAGGYLYGSPEVPINPLFDLFIFALRNREFSDDQLAELRSVMDDEFN